MPLYLYTCDGKEGWPGWLSEAEYRARLLSQNRDFHDGPDIWTSYGRWRQRAYRVAERLGWCGEMIDGPYVAGLPLQDRHHPGPVLLAWRDHAGAMYVASPFELPWMRSAPHMAWTCDSVGD